MSSLDGIPKRMGFRIRAFVAASLALISLSVLSLHVALCFHYPSSLFAVTLLLNPSLWLFVGLMSMFCTLLLSFRDRRRKLVPALCTSCRPRYEGHFLWASRNRFYHRRWREHASCKCSERSLLACHYSSDSSVHTTTQLHSTASDTSPLVTQITESSTINENSTDIESGSLLSLDGPFKDILQSDDSKKSQLSDVQNFSCLLRNDSFSEGTGNTIVVLDKGGKTKSLFSNNSNRSTMSETTAEHSSRSAFCSYTYDKCKLYAAAKRTDPEEVWSKSTFPRRKHDRNKLLTSGSKRPYTSRPRGNIISNTANASSSHNNDHLDGDSNNPLKYSKSIKHKEVNRPENGNKSTGRNNLSRCTCPSRYYLNYGSRTPIISRTNKPIMKCMKPLKSATPLHLFQVDSGRKRNNTSEAVSERSQSQSSANHSINTSQDDGSNILKEDFASIEMNGESVSYSSIVSLLPK